MTDANLLLFLVLLPFAGSVAASLLPRNARNAEAWLSGLVALAAFTITAFLYPAVREGGVIRREAQWLPELGVNFTLRMDGFGWMFSVLITGIGLLVVIYARYYMSPKDPVPRFFSFLLAFMGSMQGLVIAGNLIVLAIFWELTSIVSFLLISYWHHNQAARDGARMALTITGIGGLALLVGLMLIGHIVGSYDLDVVLASGDKIRGHELYSTALVLILLGALTKSAQFPFHFWLPNAMAAPTPVSAYLHSATMVKAGVFLLARLWPVLSGTDEWFFLVGLTGMATLMLGAFYAIFQQDLKGLLAYSTISHLGLITTLLSLGSPLAAVAAIFHMINHATFKASLFMAAGIIDHEAGTRDMRRLSGLFSFLPITATLAMVASAAMAGVPLLNGFLSKEMFFAETLEKHHGSILDGLAPYAATIASTFAVTYSVRFIHTVFFGPKPVDLPHEPHEPPHWMRLPIELLVLICLIVGIVPSITIGPYLHTAVVAVLGSETPDYSLAVWHGLNTPLIMSVIALVGGTALYLALRRYLATCEDGTPFLRNLKGQRIFERILVTISWRWARWIEANLGTRRLQPQLRLVVFAAFVAGLVPLFRGGFRLPNVSFDGLDPTFAAFWAVGIVCALGAAYQAKYHRLAALILMGGAGIVTCITFIWFSAPDLAVTQLVVEVVTTVLILLGLRWLPKRLEEVDNSVRPMDRMRRHRDFGLAVICGVGMAILAYAMMKRPETDTIANFFLENAYSEGGGKNVVNVILVDFRGFDTFGEITVLGIVALTVFALLRRYRPAADSVGVPEQQRIQNMYDDARPDREIGSTVRDYLMVPSVLMQWMFPVIILLAAFLFLRGHDLPGGGFAAGVTMAIGFLLQYLGGGTRWVEDRLRILPVRWIAFGLMAAAVTGLGAWLFGMPFLTTYFQYTEIPLIGKVPTASALLFDLGVFSLVVGATVLILIALAHQSVRSYRVRASEAAKAEEDA
ncbi:MULTISPECIES: monovalent cation/H+ antiporter subunit A [unclassified Aminobacter]|uniref:monovalent cation/H+ antiporter subunit A n=1 Tax=unclassified Aminobacter TaxID=2644704 RepID=UPI0004671B6A|nr:MULTISPECIES: monovalent cation/H+ antiporter subunit A [unclassified Aminobacter]TWH33525.1 multisubunit potassium/proton antiporter PhaA subunit /multisubunit potassium/proton antiporter PhaB subunit [Aminobacter sp. J15]